MYTTKTTLINKLANGCEIGWTDFEHTYRPLILSVAAKQGVPHSECDDILQLVMLALFNNGTFNYSREKHGKFRTYLGGIIRHKTADYFRRKQTKVVSSVPENTAVLPDFDAIYLAEYRQYILNAAIDELKQRVAPEYFEAFQLCVLQEYSDKKAAEMLGEKSNTVTVRKRRCKEILQKIISDLNSNDQGLDLPFI